MTVYLRRVWLVPLLAAFAICGCGRLSFDDLHDGGTGDALGPARSIAMPGGGQMDQVATAPDGTWYALAKLGGAFRSSDQGMTWTRCGERQGLSVAVTTDNTVWMAGADVAQSTDHCATWTPTGNPRFSNMVFADGNVVFAACDNGLRRYTGAQWVAVPTPMDGIGFNWMARGPQRYFLATQNGVLVSPDAINWASITAGFADTSIKMIAAAGTHAYAITAGGPGGISCSDGTGATWSICFGTGGFSVAVDPTADQRVFAGIYDEGLETTTAFTSVGVGFREKSMDSALVTGLTFLPSGELILTSDRGVFVAPAGSDVFAPRSTGLDAWEIDRIAVAGDDMYLATRGGPLHSAAGAAFHSTTSGIVFNTNVFEIAEAPDGRIFAAGRLMFASTDRGETWTQQYSAGGPDGYRVYSILFAGATAYAGTATRVLTADPPYTTWVPHAFPDGSHEVHALHKTPRGALLVGTQLDGVYVSTDDAATFTHANALGSVRVHTFIDLADGRVLAGTNDGVWQLDPTDTTWSRAGLDTDNVRGLRLIGGTVFAILDIGVRYTKDSGVTWTPLPGAETLSSNDAVFDATTGQLVVATDSRGLVRVPLP